MNNQIKLSKEETKSYIGYVTAHLKPSHIASKLDLPPSRISEMLSGKRRLNIDEYKILRSIVGTPNMEKGHWFMAELIQFDTLEEDFNKNSWILDLVRTYSQVKKAFNSIVLDCTHVESSNIFGYLKVEDLDWEAKDKAIYENKLLELAHKKRLLSKLLASDLYREWMATLEEFAELNGFEDIPVNIYEDFFYKNGPDISNASFNPLKDICFSIEDGFFIHTDCRSRTVDLIKILFLNYKLFKALSSPKCDEFIIRNKHFDIFSDEKDIFKNKPVKEYVITGEVVWEPVSPSIEGVPISLSRSFELSKDRIFIESIHSDENEVYKDIRLMLIFSKNYNYYLHIKLNTDVGCFGLGRELLVKVTEVAELFRQIKETLKFFRVSHDIDIESLKISLATHGALIPTAKYLD